MIDNNYEKRYFYSAARLRTGLGWLTPHGKVKVYRLDEKATEALNKAVRSELKRGQVDAAGRWCGETATRLKQMIQFITQLP